MAPIARLRSHLADGQHRDAYWLMANTVVGASAGLGFWLLVARVAALPAAAVGTGYAVVALGTILGVLGKGGFDTALLRASPATSRAHARGLLAFACLTATCIVVLLATALAALGVVPLSPMAWVLVAASGALLAVTWLQDAHFLAEGDARFSTLRNLVLSGARLAFPLLLVAVAAPEPVALAWTLALALSALAALRFGRRVPDRDGPPVPRRRFVRSALRNFTGAAAEFLPGYLLAPIVLATSGPAAAAYFGIAWTAASMLFLVSAAISRSALARLVRHPEDETACLARAARHNAMLVLPLAIVGALLAPFALRLFGAAYANEGAGPLAILCLSAILVAPTYLYLSLLRARERPIVLVLFPLAMVTVLAILAPIASSRWGLAGVAWAWLAANLPFGAWATWRIAQAIGTEVKDAPLVDHRPHAE